VTEHITAEQSKAKELAVVLDGSGIRGMGIRWLTPPTISDILAVGCCLLYPFVTCVAALFMLWLRCPLDPA